MTPLDIGWTVLWLAFIGMCSPRFMFLLIVIYVIFYLTTGWTPHGPYWMESGQ